MYLFKSIFFENLNIRTVQYGCKLIWYILWKYKNNKDYVEILKKIESTMSSTRKGMILVF